MTTGRIKTLVAERGFGFITADDGGDFFFHHKAVADNGFRQLQPGDRVEFEPDREAARGPRASLVRRPLAAAPHGRVEIS